MDKDTILVVGANGLIGQHVLKELALQPDNVRIFRTYDPDQPFHKALDGYTTPVGLESFSEALGSTTELRAALKGVTTVVNCIDYQDLSVLPDTDRIHRINSLFVAQLAQAVNAERSVARVIHVSSLLVGTSFMAPSVFHTERSTTLPRPVFAVFPDYTRAKQEAEAVWQPFEDLSVFTLRVPMVYGELDRRSFIMDVLRYAHKHGGNCPLAKRPHGKSQYAYAGNIGYGVVKALHKMRAVEQGKKEVINLVDNTPTMNTWEWMETFAKGRGLSVSAHEIPFYCFYAPWRALELSSWILSLMGVAVPEKIKRFPGSGLFYTHFFYWYFWSGVKARLYLDYLPKYEPEEAISRSIQYYNTVDLDLPKSS